MSRHNAIYNTAVSPSLGSSREGRFILLGRRSEDILLPHWTVGLDTAWDVTVIRPLQAATVAGASASSGHALEVAVQRKNRWALRTARDRGSSSSPLGLLLHLKQAVSNQHLHVVGAMSINDAIFFSSTTTVPLTPYFLKKSTTFVIYDILPILDYLHNISTIQGLKHTKLWLAPSKMFLSLSLSLSLSSTKFRTLFCLQ